VDKNEKTKKGGEGFDLTTEDFCEIANQFAGQGRYEEAIKLYERAIKIYPESLALKISLGKTRNLLKEKEEEEKAKLLEKFKDERARRDLLSAQFTSMGLIFMSKSLEQKAQECFRLSLFHNPNNVAARLELAKSFYKNNDFPNCVKELKHAISVDPFLPEVHALLGRALFYLKNYKTALNSIIDSMILDNAAHRTTPSEIHEKFKYLLEKLGIHNRVERNELVKSRLELFNQCVQKLDLEKEAVLGKAGIKGMKDLMRPRIDDTIRQDLLNLAIRLRIFPLLKDLNDENLFTIAKKVKELNLKTGEMIFDENDEGDDLYLLEKGSIKIRKETPFGEQVLSHISSGDFFGEMNFIDPASRSADSVCEEDASLFVVKRNELEPLFENSKEVAVQFYWQFWKSLSRRTRDANNLLKTFFEGSPSSPKSPLNQEEVSRSKNISIELDRKIQLLQDRGLSAKELRLLAAFSKEELYNREDLIFREGDEGDKLYIILDGKVRITKHIPGAGEEALAILEKGDFFGEMALIDNLPRSADAKAHTNGTTVLTISRQVLNEILSVDIESAYQFLSILCRILTQRLREINLKIIQWRLMSGGF
jgi:CRP/FNR family transcriptional regulator, cyclic AMP receptor protein